MEDVKMVMQRTDFASNGGLCKTDRGLVEVDNTCTLLAQYVI